MRRTLGLLLREDDGQSLVEYAVSAILFMIILFGTIDLGIGIWRYNMIADLAQQGARWASVRGSQGSSPASISDVQNYVIGRAPGFPVTVTPSVAPSTLSAGSVITVNVQHVFQPFTPLIPVGSMTLQHTAAMTISR
jgi:Flp pilus assembly protein TadG